MIKFATVLGIASLAASQALAGSGYEGGHNCSYGSAKASVPAVNTAQGYSLPATTTTVEAVQTPVVIKPATTTTYETVQTVPTDAYVAADIELLPAQ